MDDEPYATARLALPPQSETLKLQRLRDAAGEPWALETCYFPAKQFAGLRHERLEQESLFKILQRRYVTGGVVVVYVLELYRSDRHNLVIRRFR